MARAKAKVAVPPPLPPAQLTRPRPTPLVKPVIKLPEKPKQETKVEIIQESKPKKPSTDKYLRVCEDSADELKIYADKVHKGELSYAYYAIDNDKGYHYYLIIKK